MAQSSAEDRDVLHCPRCGAVADPEASHCSCCATSLGLGGRTASGERIALRMAQEPGQDVVAIQTHGRTSASGLAAVREHADFAHWMQDEPSGIVNMLGPGALIALGLLFTILALTGKLHTRAGNDSSLATVFIALLGLCTAASGGWQLSCFLRAPLLRRIARVADTRSQTQHTRHGWRTRNYATFAFEDGGQEEFQISSAAAARTTRGDCGVLITRYTALLAFHCAA